MYARAVCAALSAAVLVTTAVPASAAVQTQARARAELPWSSLGPSAGPVALQRQIRPLAVTYEWQGQRYTLDDFLKRSETRGFVVLDGQAIVAERYYRAGPSTRFQSWSMAKSFTGAAVGIALNEGHIKSIDDPVTAYVPELAGSGYAGVPIRDVLRMSSGIDWAESEDVAFLHIMASVGGSVERIARRQVRAWQPGTRFQYTSINSFVLAWVVSRATGMPFHDYFQRRIWNAAGMADRAYLGNDWHGADLGYCCIYATARDFARFGLLFLRNGRANGRQIVPESWVRASTRPSAAFNEPKGETSRGYGLQWWIGGGGHGDYQAEGLGGQKIYVSPRHGVVIVKTAGHSDTSGGEELTAFRAIAAQVAATRTG